MFQLTKEKLIIIDSYADKTVLDMIKNRKVNCITKCEFKPFRYRKIQ